MVLLERLHSLHGSLAWGSRRLCSCTGLRALKPRGDLIPAALAGVLRQGLLHGGAPLASILCCSSMSLGLASIVSRPGCARRMPCL